MERILGINEFEAFSNDKAYRNACAMCILQIGELGGHLGQEFRLSHPQMPWNEIKGMRNVMAHAYGSLSAHQCPDSLGDNTA